VEPNQRCCPAGVSIKPLKGALVKSQVIERYGKGIQQYQTKGK